MSRTKSQALGSVLSLRGGRSYETGMMTKPEGNNSQGNGGVLRAQFRWCTSWGPHEKENREVIFFKIQCDSICSFSGTLWKRTDVKGRQQTQQVSEQKSPIAAS